MNRPNNTIPEDNPGAFHMHRHRLKPVTPKTTLADWQDYLEMMARLVIQDPVYIPIFKRIEAEIARVTEEEDVIARARKIAAMPVKR